ncbi:MAG: hypothetical protein RL885_22840 [Planctomycetota bacterium]
MSAALLGDDSAEDVKGLPLAFAENRGQWNEDVRYAAKAGSAWYLFSDGRASIVAETGGLDQSASQRVRIDFVFEGAEKARPSADRRLPGAYNYLIGAPSEWVTEVPLFNRVSYEKLQPGISVQFYDAASMALEYDVLFEPAARVADFVVQCEGAESLRLDDDGALLVETSLGIIRQHIPAAWEETGESAEKREVSCHYELLEGNRYRFVAEGWSRQGRLVIDPVFSYGFFRSLQWSTFLGGSAEDRAYDVAVADFGSVAGEVFVVGTTDRSDFPVTAGVFQGAKSAFKDVFVTRLNSTGSALIYSTFIGGGCDDEGRAIDLAVGVNPDNDNALEPVLATITGFTVTNLACGTLYPTFPAVVPPSIGPWDSFAKCSTTLPGFVQTDAFVTQLNAQGTALTYSTYLGGDGPDEGHDIVVDRSVEPPNATEVFVTGWTGEIDDTACAPSTPFPTLSAFDSTFNGNKDAFCSQLRLAGNAVADLLASTYVGGADDDEGLGIALHSSGDVIIAGLTQSTDPTFPEGPFGVLQTSLNGSQDAFVFRFDGGANPLLSRNFCTYLGGSGLDFASSVVVNEDGIIGGEVTICGATTSADYPFSAGAFQTSHAGGTNDGVVTRLNAAGTAITWSTYVGGSDDDIVWDLTVVPGKTSVDICGETASTNFPTTTGAYDTSYNGSASDNFVARVRNDGTALNCSTYVGGGRTDVARGIASDGTYEVIIVGWTESGSDLILPAYPTTLGAFDTTHNGPSAGLDAFVTKLRVGNIIGN